MNTAMNDHPDLLPPYARAVRFASADAARTAYHAIQDMMHDDEALDLSVYNLLLAQVPHVVVLGEQPVDGVNDQLTGMLAGGEPTHLPPALVLRLAARRDEQDEGFSQRHHDLPDAPRF